MKQLSILLVNHNWFQPELQARGHRVISIGLRHEAVDISIDADMVSVDVLRNSLPPDFAPDWLIWYDNSRPIDILGFEDWDLPKLFLSVDVHHHHAWHPSFASMFDVTLVAQKNYLHLFEGIGSRVEWFPLWAPLNVEPAGKRTTDVCFRGTLDPVLHPKRAQFFSRLNELVPIDAATGPYWLKYPEVKIAVNQVVNGDLNFRVFETLMCGALLITPAIENGLGQLFEIGKELVTYAGSDAEDAARLIRYYLEHDDEREAIAKAGREAVLAKHTAAKRAEELEAILYSSSKEKKPKANLGAAVSYIITAETIWEHNEQAAAMVLAFSVQNLMKCALSDRELESAAYHANLILLRTYLNELGLQDMLYNLVDALIAKNPSDLILQLLKIEQLVNQNKEEEALAIATAVSTAPAEMVQGVIHLLGNASVQILERKKLRTSAKKNELEATPAPKN